MKLTAGRLADRFRSVPIFTISALRPNHTGLLFPFAARRRLKPRKLGGWQPPKIYGRIGSLEVRLARKRSEVLLLHGDAGEPRDAADGLDVDGHCGSPRASRGSRVV